MRHRIVKVIGFAGIGLCLVAIGLQVLRAYLDGDPFSGRNVYGLSIGAVLAAANLAVVVVGFAFVGAQKLLNALRRRPPRP
jgi:hypothetical protein